jgi:molybdenum cofactor synthesis domain-containing protein
VAAGDFGENLVVSGLDWAALRVGDRLSCCGALLELTQFGKECHTRCRIHQAMGDCIMPRHGVFARVIGGGTITVGDEVRTEATHRVALLTVSDKGSRGEREDLSGAVLRGMVEAKGLSVVRQDIVPDDMDAIARKLVQYADVDNVRLVLTTGGTGLSPRDVTPEATLRVVERLCPGIPEAMRAASLAVSKRAMLSRAVAGIRGGTLILNLPGSPKAVRECLGFVLDDVLHGLDILAGQAEECAKKHPATPCK